jgi:hypothetical protein
MILATFLPQSTSWKNTFLLHATRWYLLFRLVANLWRSCDDLVYTIRSQADHFCGHMVVIVRTQLYTNIYGSAEHKLITRTKWVYHAQDRHKNVICGTGTGRTWVRTDFFYILDLLGISNIESPSKYISEVMLLHQKYNCFW